MTSFVLTCQCGHGNRFEVVGTPMPDYEVACAKCRRLLGRWAELVEREVMNNPNVPPTAKGGTFANS